MKLLLILPNSERGLWGRLSKSGKGGFIRLSLPTIAALTPSEWEVEILDARVTPVDYSADVDLVGISSFTNEIPCAYAIADGFRKNGVTVVMGGVHVSALPDEALEHADVVVVGEAEDVWAKLLDDFKKNRLKKIYQARSLSSMKNMVIPRRELYDRSMYGSGFNAIQSTRGCPFDCDYCAVTAFFGNEFRTRPVEEVVAEIKAFDSKEFFFMDDNIIGRPKYAKKLFKALIPLKLTWGSQASITLARDPELMELYAKSGGINAFIGFESLSQKTLESLNKGWNSADEYADSIKKIQKAGINIIASFVFGLDGDDKSVFKNTFDFIMKNKINAAQYHILTPLPGTNTYREMDEAGRITNYDWSSYHTGEVVYKPDGMTPEELLDGYHWIFKETYKVKNILKRAIRNQRGLKYRIGTNLSYRNKALKIP